MGVGFRLRNPASNSQLWCSWALYTDPVSPSFLTSPSLSLSVCKVPCLLAPGVAGVKSEGGWEGSVSAAGVRRGVVTQLKAPRVVVLAVQARGLKPDTGSERRLCVGWSSSSALLPRVTFLSKLCPPPSPHCLS